MSLICSVCCNSNSNRISEWRKDLPVDASIHLNDLQELVIGECVKTLGVSLEECFKMVMECELDDHLAALGAIINFITSDEMPSE